MIDYVLTSTPKIDFVFSFDSFFLLVMIHKPRATQKHGLEYPKHCCPQKQHKRLSFTTTAVGLGGSFYSSFAALSLTECCSDFGNELN